MIPPLGKVELDRLVDLWRWGNTIGRDVIPGRNDDEEGRRTGVIDTESGKHGGLMLSDAREGMFLDATFKANISLLSLYAS